MAYMKRRIKKGKIKINGITLRVVDSGKHVTEGDVWIRAWWRSNGPQLPKYFEIEKAADGTIPLYVSGTEADGWHTGPPLHIGQFAIEIIDSPKNPQPKERKAAHTVLDFMSESPARRASRKRREKNERRRALTQVDASDRPPLKYQMRFTRTQWEAIEWAIDCGISAATTQFNEDKETVALVPVLQSVLDEINNRA